MHLALFLPRTCCVTWGKSLALSGPLFPDLCTLKMLDPNGLSAPFQFYVLFHFPKLK